MAKFRIGDVVRLIAPEVFDLQPGQRGIVMDEHDIPAVRFVNWHDGHNGHGRGIDGVFDGSIAYVDEKNIELEIRAPVDDDIAFQMDDIL